MMAPLATSDGARKRILVVGAGAAGTACAWSLSRFPEQFEVHVWEALEVPGGVASSCTIKDGSLTINDQVQGGAPSYRHNLHLLELFGFKPSKVNMRIAFGTGPEQWTNHSASPLTDKLQGEIARFGRVLKWISWMELLFIFIPIGWLLCALRFSRDFRYRMVLPLVALFFGTGNQTARVSSAIIARVFLDPDLRLFDYCPKRLLNSVPEMFAFPKLQDIFTTIAEKSDFKLHCSRPLAVISRSGSAAAAAAAIVAPAVGCGKRIIATDAAGISEGFDEVVFACSTEQVLRCMRDASWIERRVLKNVTYYDDFCITHDDQAYMKEMYDMRPAQRDNYFIRTYSGKDQHKIEMSFNLSTYQPHLKEAGLDVYQTYYLDARDKHLWTDVKVAKDKVLASRWMRQFAHTWTHFAFFVPFVRLLQGRSHTWYCGSHCLFNTQEIAVMSGLAVAERFGVPYPFPEDPLAASQFDLFMFAVHGTKRRKGPAQAQAQASSQAAGGKAADQGVAAAPVQKKAQ